MDATTIKKKKNSKKINNVTLQINQTNQSTKRE